MIKSLLMPQNEKITSRENRRLVHVRKIRDGENSEEIFVEGRRLVDEALRSNLEPTECFISEDLRDRELIGQLNRLVPVFEISEKLFRSIADTETSQGIILIAKRSKASGNLADFRIRTDGSRLPHVVYLKEANNPSNLGAIFRTAEAAGISGIIVSPRSAEAFSPKALRAAMGSSFRIKIWEGVELGHAIDWARQSGMRIAATEPESGIAHTSYDWTQPTLIVFGSEAHGLSDEELLGVDARITIPLVDTVESLNLAVAAGVVLFEASRQVFTK